MKVSRLLGLTEGEEIENGPRMKDSPYHPGQADFH